MKRLATLALVTLLGTVAYAETVLICHAQSVPVALTKTFKSPLTSSLIDGVFDYFFDKGDITFDTAFSLSDGVPTSAWLGSLTGKFGADKVVYFQVIWKSDDLGQAVLDRVDWQVVGPRGNVLREGSFSADLVSPSTDEGKQIRAVTARVLAGLAS